jgi:hypothetical protein
MRPEECMAKRPDTHQINGDRPKTKRTEKTCLRQTSPHGGWAGSVPAGIDTTNQRALSWGVSLAASEGGSSFLFLFHRWPRHEPVKASPGLIVPGDLPSEVRRARRRTAEPRSSAGR